MEEKTSEESVADNLAKEVLEKEKEELTFLNEYLSELIQRREWKNELRASNTNVENRPEESDLHKLDSSLKKNTAFVRKVKNFSEAQKDSILKEMTTLNLTKYIGEVAAAIVEAKLKMNDLPGIIEISSKLHQRYAEFSPFLLAAWQKSLGFKKDEKISNSSKLRVDLRLYSDLISVGIFSLKDSLSLLGSVLMTLVAMDKEDHSHIAIILTFCKHCGDEYAGLVPRKVRLVAEKFGRQIPPANLLPTDKQKNVRQMLRDYFLTVCKHLVSEHSELVSVERTNRRIMITKGEVHVERKERAESLQNAFSKLLLNAEMMADVLDEDMPELTKEDPKKKLDEELDGNEEDSEVGVEPGSGVSSQLWEDEDAKNFYENLYDLKPIVPAILYKDVLQQKKSSEAAEAAKSADDSAVKIEVDETEDGDEDDDLNEPINEDEEVAPPDIDDDADEGDSQTTSTKMLLDAFLGNLPNCVNREMIDSAAAEFCLNLNTKINRKKLVKALFSVHRNRQDLLPFYARFVATLNPLIPDIATDLGTYLKQEFRWQVRKKDQMKIESKLKVCRFIGELVKFHLFPKSECLFCLKQLLFDFSHHHIDMVCTFMEVCGRFLYFSPESHRRTKIYLDQMMRKKIAISMDSRYIMMIENAYYSVNPPDLQQESKPKRPPLEQFVVKLLYTDLGKNNTEKILKIIRKLNWENPDEVSFAVRLLGDVWNYKFYNIRYAASLLAGLVFYHEWVGPQVLDNVLEDIRLMMEINMPKYNQRRIAVVKFLAELYNYRLVDSGVIFRVLYSFVTFGTRPDQTSNLDPPDHLLRIRLVCTILDTCGIYFNSGNNKKKLDYFLVYFQQYYLRKRLSPFWNEDNPFPFAISSQVFETLPALRPKMALMTTQEEADAAVKKIEDEMVAKILEKAPQLSQLFNKMSISGSAPIESAASLHTIDEDMEDDEDLEEEDDRHSTSRSRSASQLENREDDDDDDDGSQSDEESNDEELDEENEPHTNDVDETVKFQLPSAPKHMACEEDDDFVAMFDKMLNENIAESRTIAARVGGQQVPPAPGRLLKKTYEQLQTPDPVDTVQFSVLLRKGTKQAYKEVAVSADSDIARNLQKQEEADRLEKERVKKLTLEMNERQEEEDLNDAIATMQRPLNTMSRGVDRRFRQPVKGTPDADAIFGSKRAAR